MGAKKLLEELYLPDHSMNSDSTEGLFETSPDASPISRPKKSGKKKKSPKAKSTETWGSQAAYQANTTSSQAASTSQKSPIIVRLRKIAPASSKSASSDEESVRNFHQKISRPKRVNSNNNSMRSGDSPTSISPGNKRAKMMTKETAPTSPTKIVTKMGRRQSEVEAGKTFLILHQWT